MSVQDIQGYYRAASSAREYYNRVTNKEEPQKDKDKDDGTFSTVSKIGSKIGDISKVSFSFDKSSGVKIAGMINNPLEASLTELTPAMKEYAEMVKISTVLHKSGAETAIKRLKTNHPDYELDVANSTDHYAIVKKPNGKVIIGFRGTDPGAKIKSGLGKGAREPWMWIAMQGGSEDIFEEHKMKNIKDKILTKYRPDQIEQITGYSMGASKAKILGDMLNVDTHLYNPYIGKKFYDTTTPNTKHQVVRTTEDIASTIRYVIKPQKMPDNVKVDSIDPINTIKMQAKKIHSQAKSDLQSFNALDNHNLEHFTSDGDRSYLLRDLNDKINDRVAQFEEQTRGLSSDSTEFNRLKEQMITDLQPTTRLASQETQIVSSRSKMFKSLKPSNIVTALAGVAGGAAVDNLINDIESATGLPIDDHITTAISGGLGALPQETVARFFGGKINFARAVTGGIAGAVAQELTAQGTDAVLQALGMDADSSEIVSQTLGGGVGGAVTAGGAALARQIAVRIGARIAAAAGAELTATALGAEIGSIVPGFGTLIGAGIGALVSLGFAIFDIESRKHAPLSEDEEIFLESAVNYIAEGVDADTILDGIEDSTERDRLRNFLNSDEYQDKITEEQRSNVAQVERYGATVRDIERMQSYIAEQSPDFFSGLLTAAQKNTIIEQLASDPEHAQFFAAYATLPVYIEGAPGEGMIDADWTTPSITVRHNGAVTRAHNEYINSPEYAQRQEDVAWLNDLLINDEEFNNASNATIANQRVYDLINRVALDILNPDSDIAVNLLYNNLVPQFDNQGNITMQGKYDEPLIVEGEFAVPIEDYQTIITEPRGTRARTGAVINNDAQIQKMLLTGDIEGINARIREIFEENKNVRAFDEVISYDDAELPQFTADGQLVYQRITDPAPTDPIQPEEEPEVVEPEPEPEEEVAIRPQVTRETEIARKRSDIAYKQQAPTRRGPTENINQKPQQRPQQTQNMEQEQRPRQRRQNVELEGR
jgi:hypothetical protein